MKIEIGDDAIDARMDVRALHVQQRNAARQTRGVECRPGLSHGGARSGHFGDVLFVRLGRHQIAERDVPARFTTGQIEIGFGIQKIGRGAFDGRVGLPQHGRVTGPVQHEKKLAGVHAFVVVNENLGDESTHIRRHAHYVRAHMAVARPRIFFIALPDRQRSGDCRNHENERCSPTAQRSE
jgi:hypothetical protein